MKTNILLVLLVCLLAFHPLVADTERTADQKKAALDFTLAKVQIGMSPDQVTQLGLTLKPDLKNSEKDFYIDAFDVENPSGMDIMYMVFFKGKVYDISAGYGPATLGNIGGWKTLLERLTQKLGDPEESASDIDDSQKATWQFYDENRFFSLELAGSTFFIDVDDKDASRQIHELRKAKANVGF